MGALKITQNVYVCVLGLLEGYTDLNMPPVEYLINNEDKFSSLEDCESVAELFMCVVQHRQLLLDVTNNFYRLGKRKDHSDQNCLVILSYILISVLNNTNKKEVITVLSRERLTKVVNLLNLFNRNSILEELFLAGCQYFEEQYVRQKLTSNLTENKGVLQELIQYFVKLLDDRNKEHRREVSKPVSPRLTSIHRPTRVASQSQKHKLQTLKTAPKSIFKDPKISKIFPLLKKNHKGDSLNLLDAANKEYVPTSRTTQHTCLHPEDTRRPVHPPKIVQKSDVLVRKNAATILREAFRATKEEGNEIQRIMELSSGSANYTKYDVLLEQVRANEEQANLEDIERKHLRGLLTREEAILAKQNLLEMNKAKRSQIDLEKKETEELARKMRQEHDEKIKKIIENIQKLQMNIAEKKKSLMGKKQKDAQKLVDTNRQLYEEVILRQRAELEKQIQMIKEIKALSTINHIQENKFDPTETMNVGLLCEMSMAELNERLLINRASVKEEIENRQKYIKNQRLKQHQFLSDTEQFIEAFRQHKNEMKLEEEKLKTNKPLQESRDIVELREKLQLARNKRMELKNKAI